MNTESSQTSSFDNQSSSSTSKVNKAKTWIGFLMLSPSLLMGLLWMVFGIARSWTDEIYWVSVHLPKTVDEAIATGIAVGIPALCGIWLLKK